MADTKKAKPKAKEKKQAGGRPTKYQKSYCEFAEEFVGVQGKSIVQLARELRVCKDTIYEWANVHQEFSDSLRRARDWSEAFWEDRFVGMMCDKNINAPLVKLYFANRFKWSEKDDDVTQVAGNLVVQINKD